MVFAVLCPTCGGRIELEDEPEGQPTYCPACDNMFMAEPALAVRIADRLPELRARDLDAGEEDDTGIALGTTARLLLAGTGILATFIVLVATISWYWAITRGPSETVAVSPAQPPAPVDNPVPSATPAVQSVAWRVTADPGLVRTATPADSERALTLAANDEVLYPSSCSPFVCLGHANAGKNSYRVWNLATMTLAGSLHAEAESIKPMALSPDGRHVAARNDAAANAKLQVWPVTSQSAAVKPVEIEVRDGTIETVDFAGTDLLFAMTHQKGQRTLHVWDVTTGSARRRRILADLFDARAVAPSPGGRFLAVISHQKNLIVYDLIQGDIAGELKIAERPDWLIAGCAGMAFSPDGEELAAIFDAGETVRLLTWEVSTGSAVVEHKFSREALAAALAGKPVRQGLEWFPDRSGWLIHGRLLIDRRTGTVLWTVPPRQAETVRFLDSTHLVALAPQKPARAIKLLPLPRSLQAEARDAMAGGQSAGPALPQPRPADWSSVRTLPPVSGTISWQAAADPAPEARAGLATLPIELPYRGKDLVALHFSCPERARAAVLAAPEVDSLSLRRHRVRAACLDLNARRIVAEYELFDVSVSGPLSLVSDLSRDGACLAVSGAGNRQRVDIWHLLEKRHIVGWLPYEQDQGSTISWLAFVDVQRLLTLSTTGKLMLWSVPDCRALFAREGCGGKPVLSPGHRFLAILEGSTYSILDSATGELRGRLSGPVGVPLKAAGPAAFSRTGHEFAAILSARNVQPRLCRWEMVHGTRLSSFAIHQRASELHWCNQRFVLADDTLYDCNQQLPLWRFPLKHRGRSAWNAPDDRYWYALGRSEGTKASLCAKTLPDKHAAQAAQLLAQPGAPVLVRPGKAVNLEVQVTDMPALSAQDHEKLRHILATRLLELQIQVTSTGVPRLRVELSDNACDVTLFDQQGQLGYRARLAYPPSGSLMNRAERAAQVVALPECVFHDGAKYRSLPGTTLLDGS